VSGPVSRPLACLCGSLLALALLPAESQPPPRLLIALSSFRDRPLHPRLYFYEHDGAANGKAAGALEPVNLRVETHPSLALGGRRVACASELENSPSEIRLFDVETKREIGELLGLNSEAVEIEAAISADGRWLAFSGWQRPGAPAGWNLFLYSLEEKKAVPLPVNTD
jgi:hypothetical protein